MIHLVCSVWTYDEPRQLLLHRIRAATVLEAGARRPPAFDIDACIAAGEFDIPATKTWPMWHSAWRSSRCDACRC